MSPVEPHRWTFVIPNPAGDVHVTYHLTPDAMAFESDALWNGGQFTVPWSAIREAGTTTVGMPVGRGRRISGDTFRRSSNGWWPRARTRQGRRSWGTCRRLRTVIA